MTAPIIVSALFAPDDQAWLDGLRRAHFPPERNRLDAHLTLFHHLPPSIGDELARRLRVETHRWPPPVARVSRVLDLGGGTALGVASGALVEIRSRLADAFAGLLTPQDGACWRPHVTIQNKVPREAAKALQATIADRHDGRTLRIAALASWWYRGGPWERIGTFRFDG